MYTVIGGSVLLTTLTCYFSHSIIVENAQQQRLMIPENRSSGRGGKDAIQLSTV